MTSRLTYLLCTPRHVRTDELPPAVLFRRPRGIRGTNTAREKHTTRQSTPILPRDSSAASESTTVSNRRLPSGSYLFLCCWRQCLDHVLLRSSCHSIRPRSPCTGPNGVRTWTYRGFLGRGECQSLRLPNTRSPRGLRWGLPGLLPPAFHHRNDPRRLYVDILTQSG